MACYPIFIRVLYFMCVLVIFIFLIYNTCLCVKKYFQRPTYYENDEIRLKAKYLPAITICSDGTYGGLKIQTLLVSIAHKILPFGPVL